MWKKLAAVTSLTGAVVIAIALWLFYPGDGGGLVPVGVNASSACENLEKASDYDMSSVHEDKHGGEIKTDVKVSGKKYHFTMSVEVNGTSHQDQFEVIYDGITLYSRMSGHEWVSQPAEDHPEVYLPEPLNDVCPALDSAKLIGEDVLDGKTMTKYEVESEYDRLTLWIDSEGWLRRIDAVEWKDTHQIPTTYYITELGEINGIQVPSVGQ